MLEAVQQVLSGERRWAVEQGECPACLSDLPDACVDLVCGSPPYELARLYLENGQNLGVARDTDEWVAWMVEVVRESRRVCRGLVAFVVEGQTEDFRYSCGPILLMAELCRGGFNLRKPPIFHRVGVPGSGGPDWLRNDYEFVVCVTPPGKLPYSDNTAMGHAPKWAPGGAMSNRLTDGSRVNDDPWGKRGRGNNLGGRQPNGEKNIGTNKKHGRGRWGETGHATGMAGRYPNGQHKPRRCPNGTNAAGDMECCDSYDPPAIANPGNTIQQTYTADEVAALLAEANDMVHCKVGGGVMGDKLCHKNEAPYPEPLPEFFIRSFCPPGGIVLDPFSGSGTTAAVAVRCGRRAIGFDLRQSQVELSRKRITNVTPLMFDMV